MLVPEENKPILIKLGSDNSIWFELGYYSNNIFMRWGSHIELKREFINSWVYCENIKFNRE